MLQHVRALPRPLPVPVAGTVVSLTAHAALLGALVVGDGAGADGADEPVVAQLLTTSASPGAERLHWVGIAEGPGTGAARPGERPPSAYVVPGRAGAQRGALGGGPGGGRTSASAFGDVLAPPAAPVPRVAPPPLPDLVLPDVAPLEAATVLVAGVLAAAPDRERTVSRPEDFTRLPASDAMPDLLSVGGALALTPVHAHGQVDVLPIPLVDNPLPPYPAALVRSNVGGRVVVEFRIDSTGSVDLGSLQIVQSTDTLFTQAVRGVLPLLRFVPAQLREHAVGLTVRQPFVFRVVARR